jgi:subtilisin family serine protease
MRYTKKNYIILPSLLILAIHIYVPVACGQQVHTPGWQLLDLSKNGVMGISADLAYEKLLIGKNGVPVVVALIDGGVDTGHHELSSVLWQNKDEIPGNGKDDDNNGYIDDLHGWNFLGSAKGSFQQDNYDVVRQLRISTKGSLEADQLKNSIKESRLGAEQDLEEAKATVAAIDTIIDNIGTLNPTLVDLKKYRYRNYAEEQQLIKIVSALRQKPDLSSYRKHLLSLMDKSANELNYSLNIEYNPRKDKQFRIPFNGNSDVQGPWAVHGSHVAGIIAGRTIGVAKNNVKLMILRVVPAGDYLDEDMARAIRYATDNGAKVINISAGKSGSTNPTQIESAVQYAMNKDVLIVHASGNYGQLLEKGYYPRATDSRRGKANAWIEVGASSSSNDSTILLKASNYGKAVVDVFAPGANIRSCSPNNGYTEQSGTSMAAPIVAGIAGVLRSYYPTFSAEKIREIILGSVNHINYRVLTSSGIMVPFMDVCSSGGIANLYRALKQAERLKEQ